ncbi:MAG TPA: hypothetical protein VMG40_14225 [Bryobacteraceae bacterium]|nr:hypothetical protein [Bryobacteraceae bacterium]
MRFSLYLGIFALLAHGQTAAPPAAPTSKPAEVREGEGSAPRAAATDYQAQVKVGDLTLAAEFAGHSIPTPEGPLSSEDYVVVEAAFYGAPGATLALSYHDFSLRVNGGKKILNSDSFALVDIKDPEWAPPQQEKSKTSFGGGGQQDSGPPTPPKVPFDVQRKLVLRVEKLSFPEGQRLLPRAGLLFFRYHGKEKGIHSLELIYSGPAGNATLALPNL